MMHECGKCGAALDTGQPMHGPAASLPGKDGWRVRAPGSVSFPVSGRSPVHPLRLKLSDQLFMPCERNDARTEGFEKISSSTPS